MSENVKGGAGPAVAAHSKDASATGSTPASSATGAANRGAVDSAPGTSEAVRELSQQARDAAGRAASSVSDAADSASQLLSGQGARVAHQAASFVREQPLVALVSTGAICLVLGILLGRR
jgi:ElaB/YqjD/DUF883 family membrane-anchored ribosome-binding protein